MHKMALNTT